MSVRDTSIETFRQISEEGLLSERRLQVYTGLYDFGPCTANELHQRMGRSMGTKNVQANLHARLNELRELGVAREVQTRTCSVTGRHVIEFDVTSKLPTELVERETPKQRIKKLEHENHKLVLENRRLRSAVEHLRRNPTSRDQLSFLTPEEPRAEF